jgi:amino acid transporter
MTRGRRAVVGRLAAVKTPSTEAGNGSEPLLRQLSVWGIALLVVNGTIGAGIFGLPGKAAALTGAWSPVVILLCGFLLVPIVLAFAEASSCFRGTGGPILYARTAFGPLVGFQTGWAFYVTRLSASAANLALLVASLAHFEPGLAEGGSRVGLLFVLSASLVWVNVVGAKQAMRWVGVLTVLKFVPLLLLVVVGIGRVDPGAVLAAELPPAGDIGAAVMLLVYAYVGWESALVPGGEARDPARDMPRALLVGLLAIVVLYVLIFAVAGAVLPELAGSQRPLVEVGAALLGPAGALILTLGVLVSVGGNVASATFSTPRITYAMAREGLLPRWFGAVHATYRTPSVSIVVYGLLVFVMAAFGSFVWLAEISVLSRILIYLVGALSLPRLRRRFAAEPGGRLRLPAAGLMPAAATAVCLLLLSQIGLDAVLVTGAFLLVGSLLFLLARRGEG